MEVGHRLRRSLYATLFLIFYYSARQVSCLTTKTTTTTKNGALESSSTSFSLPIRKVRPKAESSSEKFWSLWNDKRSVVSLIRDNANNKGGGEEENESGNNIPYCIVSDEFQSSEGFRFQVLLYPRGVTSSTDQPLRGTPASAYLLFLPSEYGEEVDVIWKFRLINDETGESLPIASSGGLPKSKDTWSAAMTFCAPNEAVDSVGRTSDWGSSSWNSLQVCACLSSIRAEGEIRVVASRRGETSFSWPPRGALAAARRATTNAGDTNRTFRAGEVIVTVPKDSERDMELQKLGVYPGVDYRVMTLTDGDGRELFSTESLPEEERANARLALRPVGWKLQEQMWQTRGLSDWPVEVEAGKLSSVSLSRFNLGAFLPRFGAFFAQDFRAVLFALTIALAPIPLALVGREFFSFYAIPSASMDPTLQKGDVLLVEKLPGIFDRTHRGDIVLFKPPSALLDIVNSSGGRISKEQLFVKRIVGMPGDKQIEMQEESQEVLINGVPAMGPSRSLCDDEPLRLIDKLLADGKGKTIDSLGSEEAYVLGDCKAVSVDSRVFGKLPKKNVVGKPVARIWPLQRFTIGSP